jgi:hypothetical protein
MFCAVRQTALNQRLTRPFLTQRFIRKRRITKKCERGEQEVNYQLPSDVNHGGNQTPPGVPVEIDTSSMLGRFFKFKSKIAQMSDQASAHMVVDDGSLARAVEMGSQATMLRNAIEKRRKEVTQPLLDGKRRIDGAVNRLTTEIDGIVRVLDGRCRPYLAEKERKRVEAAAQKAAAAASESGGKAPHPASAAMPTIPEVVDDRVKIKTDSGSMTIEKKSVPVIEDLAASLTDPGLIRARRKCLEKEVLTYVRQAMKLGREDFPGIRIQKKDVLKRRVA